MRRLGIICVIVFYTCNLHAAHIAGGELQYKYLGLGNPGNDRFLLVMRLFRECSSSGPKLQNEIVNVGIYGTSSLTLKANVVLNLLNGIDTLRLLENAIPCLVGSPNVCYEVAVYTNEIELPRTTDGYTLAWARCCRANGLINATGQIGATYVAYIPGTNVLPNEFNSSPEFVVKDTALVCGDNDFVLDFGAFDIDGDSLTYEFCDAFLGGTTGNQNAPPASNLSLQSIPYAGYTGVQPLGPAVTISRTTGIISGVAPKTPGRYVVNVCVTEWRHGSPISQHRKDFILKVGDCNIIAAKLNDQYVNCDSFTVHLQNETNSSQVKSYFWDFGVPSMVNDTSIVAQPVFTYPDTGVYLVKLIINRNEECSDTATSFIKIFPGFSPKFTMTGSCFINPFQFSDASTASYGVINSWKWDFGVTGALNDTSRLKNPAYQYNQVGPKEVTLTVGSSKGCVGIFKDTADVTDKPYLSLPFKDTLICSVDSLQLQAIGNGIFTWTPGSNIINSNTSSPVVFPKQTTTYYVELNENTCVNKDSVKVNVITAVTLKAANDTAMCHSDSIQLKVTSIALSYSWTPVLDINDPTAKEPMISPVASRQYKVTGNVGKCFATDSINIVVSPYPYVFAGNDTSICYGDKVQLHGNVLSTTFDWSPTNTMINSSGLSPTVGITKDTYFILTGHGYEQCPKSKNDSVLIKVIPPVKAFAGNDTSVTVGQPLTLQATGGMEYAWFPEIFLDNSNVPNPTAVFGSNIDSIRYRVTITTQDGCRGSDDITIVVFKTGPQIFVPGAFTPNNDTKNDLFYPVITGMKSLEYFRVYNRYGQLLFSTGEENKGWDGKFGGKDQPAGTYVYMAQAINYKGEVVSKKGVVVLIR
jgi:gliding motility-associated-like protein